MSSLRKSVLDPAIVSSPSRLAGQSKASVKPTGDQLKKLIADIERKYGTVRSIAKNGLRSFCDDDINSFGVPGSPERRGIQEQVQKWKRSTRQFQLDKQILELTGSTKGEHELETKMSQLRLAGKAKMMHLKKAKSFSSDSDDDDDKSVSPKRRCQCVGLLPRLLTVDFLPF
jgi:hypothetical protein